MPLSITETKDGLLLKVKVQAGAKRDEVIGEYDGGLKVRLAAPPVEGKANNACVEFLAGVLNLSKNDVVILRGHTSPIKTFLIKGISKEALIKTFCL